MDGPTVVEQRIMKLFSDRMSLQAPSRNLDLLGSGYLDSLTFVTLLQHLEVEFGIRISLEELDFEHFRSIARIAELIVGQPPGQATAI
jgi:acyl carrier protein